MMATSHMIVGAASWSVAAWAMGTPVGSHGHPEGLALAVLGSLLPDIDHPDSWLGRKLRFISVPLAMVVGHRGITHSLLAVLGCLVALGFFGFGWMAAPITIGYLSHLAADSLTPSGVPLLWPSKQRFTVNLMRTGSAVEWGVVLLIGAVGAGTLDSRTLHGLVNNLLKAL